MTDFCTRCGGFHEGNAQCLTFDTQQKPQPAKGFEGISISGLNKPFTGVLPDKTIPDHWLASAEVLEGFAAVLRNRSKSPEDIGRDVELLGRIMARRT